MAKGEKKDKKKDLTIMFLPSGSPYVNLWHIWENTKEGAINLVKVTQPVQEQVVNGAQGMPIKQKVLGQFEFFAVDFFSDGLVFEPITDGFFTRTLESTEDLYKGYMSVVTARKKQQIELEAQKKMKEAEEADNVTEMTQ